MPDNLKDVSSAFPSEQGHIPDGTWNQTSAPVWDDARAAIQKATLS